MKIQGILLVLLVAAAFIAVPAAAGEKYTNGAPEMSVYISGTNEFSPGDDTTLNVVISNTGEVGTKLVSADTMNRDDIPSTARLVSIDILDNGAPVTIKTDAQMLGSIYAGNTAKAAFSMTVDKYAAPGVYNLIADLKYNYLYYAEQIGQNALTSKYKTVDLPVNLRVVIKENMQLEVLKVETDAMNVGIEGLITLTVQNVGAETGYNTIMKIAKADGSAVVPTDATSYIGTYGPGDVVEVTFKASVSNTGEAGNYPVLIYADYQDSNGKETSSKVETLGVPVGGKIKFEITSDAAVVAPGAKTVISVTYKNIGDTIAYNAQSRISAVDPFTSNDDTAFLGDIAPGESAVANYMITVDGGATKKLYGLDTEVRYRDARDNSQVSSSMKVQVQVGGGGSILTNPVVLVVIVFAIIFGVYYLYKRRIIFNKDE